MNDGKGLEMLDVLTIISFCLQLQNQSNIIGIKDVQRRSTEPLRKYTSISKNRTRKSITFWRHRKHENH